MLVLRLTRFDPKPSLTSDPVKHLHRNPWLEVVPVPIIVARSRQQTTLGRILLGALRREAKLLIGVKRWTSAGWFATYRQTRLYESPSRLDGECPADPMYAGRTRRRCSG